MEHVFYLLLLVVRVYFVKGQLRDAWVLPLALCRGILRLALRGALLFDEKELFILPHLLLVAGHLAQGKLDHRVDLDLVARLADVIVFLMLMDFFDIG